MKPIGVLGASGAVGSAAAQALTRLGLGPLRLGARNRDRLQPLPSAELVAVDVTDPVALRSFVHHCHVVLDCTGPSYELGEVVPVAAAAEGVPCVVVTGEQPVYDKLTAAGRSAVPVVLSAGALPGLSGLLPRLLAGVASGGDLVAYTGGLEQATSTVAADLVLSLGMPAAGRPANLFGEAGAAWRDGEKRSRVLTPADDVGVPGFPGRVAAQPFLSLEFERVAADLGLRSLDSWHVHPGTAVRSVLATLPAARHANTPMSELVDRIRTAADVDLVGRTPYYRMIFTMNQERSFLVVSPDSYRLTGAVGACAVQQILDGLVAPGVHFADRALQPERLLSDLGRADPQTRIDLVEGDAQDEEGTL